MQGNRGFTLVEMVIVVAVIAILAAIAVPNLLAAKIAPNEAAAIATLREIARAQVQCRVGNGIDLDGNGIGEYGFIAELSGRVGIRAQSGQPSDVSLAPHLLSPGAVAQVQFQGTPDRGGAFQRTGYYFAVFLPDAGAAFVAEAGSGGASPLNNPNVRHAENVWCAYAWPQQRQGTGNRVFFVNQSGAVLAADNNADTAQYSGAARGPGADAAYLSGSPKLMTSPLALGAVGSDGQTWTVVQ